MPCVCPSASARRHVMPRWLPLPKGRAPRSSNTWRTEPPLSDSLKPCRVESFRLRYRFAPLQLDSFTILVACSGLLILVGLAFVLLWVGDRRASWLLWWGLPLAGNGFALM